MKVLIRTLAARLLQLSPPTITAIALCAVLAISAIDYFSPAPMSFVLFYMLVAVFAAWGAGKWHGLLVSGVAVIAISAVEWTFHRGVPQTGLVAVWNSSTRFLAFTIATIVRPEILVIDEMLSAGDIEFIDKARTRIQGLLDG